MCVMTRRKSRKSASAKKTAIALLRVSKDKKVQELGLDAQRAAIASWAAREDVEVVAEHMEEVSGGAPLEKRPVLAAAVADVAERKAEFLVTLKVDRFSRDRIETGSVELQLRRSGAELVFADGIGNGSAPVDEFMRTILLGAAQLERATIRARIQAALRVKQDRGEMTGKPPYGFTTVDGPPRLRKDGTVRPVKMLAQEPSEQATIAAARALSAQGLSVRKVIAQLAADGHLNRECKPFTVRAMWTILTRSGS